MLPCDPGCSVLRNAAVDVVDGRITWVGPVAEAPPHSGPVRALPGVLMPGLVNTHCHTPMLLLRGMGGDLPLLRWLHEVMWPAEGRLTASDVRTGMVSGCVELLRTGTTTSVEMYFFTDAVIDAVLAVGSRVLLTPGVIAAPGLGPARQLGGDAQRDLAADRPATGCASGPPSGSSWATGRTRRTRCRAAALAVGRGARAGAGGAAAPAPGRDGGGGRGAAGRARLGAGAARSAGGVRGRVLAAHGVHLSDDDIGLLAARGSPVAHCPGSNAKLAAGVARVAALRRAGVRVGLGTDGPASGDDLDLWSQARLAGLLARVTSGDAAALTAPELLLMATREGAAAIGRDDLGPLAPVAGPTWCTSTWPTRRSSTRPTTASCCRTWSGRRARGWSATCGWPGSRCWRTASRRGWTARPPPASCARSPPASTPDPLPASRLVCRRESAPSPAQVGTFAGASRHLCRRHCRHDAAATAEIDRCERLGSRPVWTNWSGGQQSRPRATDRPLDEAGVVAAVLRAADRGLRLRPVGARWSWSSLAVTDDVHSTRRP